MILDSKTVLFLESSKNIGGQELQLLQQMQELNNLGWKTKLLCRPQARIHDFAIAQGIDVQAVGFRNALHIPSIRLVIQTIYLLKPTALICHSGHDAVIAAIAAKLIGLFQVRPQVIRMRTYQPGMPSSFPYNWLFDKTYTPSEHLREKILKNKKINQSKIGVLYPGINFQKLDEATGRLNPDLLIWLDEHPGPIISHGAMLRGEKGHATILQALPKILQKFPEVRYVIAGEGGAKEELQSLVEKLHLHEHVYFAGMVQPISALLKISTLAILPSLMEPLGMFQIESQYLGIPTIASRVDGVPETLIHEQTGLLVEANNSNEWARQIIWALGHLPQMQAWAKEGHLFVINKFSMVRNTQELVKILEG
ncbi:glycosyltransferase family 4 protein [Polynucleobacter sp. MWH-Spelu-300-X4]|uniref:glycosyltransferase family 4 protein n=1 Tax=Polynucleobacter sp. MWH-Spelu-300-X4 TaxID=2689109 RepID=UPI001BFCF203|nr:glycosyltransferase family 4 protein [Polynucleobacter sp. MWH-Spelu-300-X4]QWD80063.1 glycosyltransferase family 4 protein [Polynucleobacter sp. MWH-Spelu-300-X4]